MKRILLFAGAIAVLFTGILSAVGQDAVPGEILQRTLFIKAGNESGTAFAVDHSGKLYLVTARHVVAGIGSDQSTIQISRSGKWLDYHIVKIIFPLSDDTDIAILKTDEKVSKPFDIVLSHTTPTFGQQVWFLGYPWGLHTISTSAEFPFIKRGTMSAMDATNLGAIILYIDGFNNPGFSGGPILYWDMGERIYKIAGVVQGYKEDTAKVIVNGQHVNTQWLVNSGILVGYSIQHVIDALEKDAGAHK